jgi:hypothetical protein
MTGKLLVAPTLSDQQQHCVLGCYSRYYYQVTDDIICIYYSIMSEISVHQVSVTL